MKAIIIFNLIVNILLIAYVIYRENRLYIAINRVGDKVCSYSLMWNSKPLRKGLCATSFFHIPIRNARKLEVKEKIEQYKNRDHQSKLQFLSATFSWLETDKEVEQFYKDYISLDREIVKDLCRNYFTKDLAV